MLRNVSIRIAFTIVMLSVSGYLYAQSSENELEPAVNYETKDYTLIAILAGSTIAAALINHYLKKHRRNRARVLKEQEDQQQNPSVQDNE